VAEPFTVELEPRALEDVTEAAAWYEQQHSGLGAQFLQAFEEVLERLAARPLASPPLRSVPLLRRTSMEKFPYGVVFRVAQASRLVEVLACWHQRRDPSLLVRRLRGEA
jgi:plasmid stabilization system protein ParE